MKKPVSRLRSKSVPVRKSETFPSLINQSSTLRSKTAPSKLPDQPKTPVIKNFKKIDLKEPQSIVLTRGCLKLSLRFPADAMVKFQEKTKETILMRNTCYCKNVPIQVL